MAIDRDRRDPSGCGAFVSQRPRPVRPSYSRRLGSSERPEPPRRMSLLTAARRRRVRGPVLVRAGRRRAGGVFVPEARRGHRRQPPSREGRETVQFYLNGYRPGDPLIRTPIRPSAGRPGRLPAEVDVLIVGCGPAGLVLAAQMANFPDITTRIVDRRGGPLEVRSGRRGRVSHGGDVRGVRSGGSSVERGLLGQRGRLLAARPG